MSLYRAPRSRCNGSTNVSHLLLGKKESTSFLTCVKQQCGDVLFFFLLFLLRLIGTIHCRHHPGVMSTSHSTPLLSVTSKRHFQASLPSVKSGRHQSPDYIFIVIGVVVDVIVVIVIAVIRECDLRRHRRCRTTVHQIPSKTVDWNGICRDFIIMVPSRLRRLCGIRRHHHRHRA